MSILFVAGVSTFASRLFKNYSVSIHGCYQFLYNPMLEKIIKLIPATKKKTFDGVGSFN
jgi:hypothetical protein